MLTTGVATFAVACGTTSVRGRDADASTPPVAVTLATASSPTRLVLDNAYAYFTTCTPSGGGVSRVLLAGGPVTSVAQGPNCPVDLAFDGGELYVAGLNGNDVARLDSIRPTILVVAKDALNGIVVDATSVYMTTATSILVAPRQGGTATTLATVTGQRAATRPIADADHVYWADPLLGTLNGVAKSDGTVTTLSAALDGVTALALFDSDVYVAAGYVIAKVPTAGGASTTLGTAAGAQSLAIAVDARGVYFSSTGVLWSLPTTGGALTTVATDHGDLDAIALAKDAVYWTSAPPCDASDASDCQGRIASIAR
ncbi:MAG TPA: hypothetical protein VH062_20570 [Polyangiaceae bacterium]|nr:hypothetical protein [Polyangiaceae bacterium]